MKGTPTRGVVIFIGALPGSTTSCNNRRRPSHRYRPSDSVRTVEDALAFIRLRPTGY